MMPLAWAVSSADAICAAYSTAVSIGSGPCASTLSSGARFLDESTTAVRIDRGVGGEHLDRDAPSQAGVYGAVDDPHSAAPDLVLDRVVADTHPGIIKGPPESLDLGVFRGGDFPARLLQRQAKVRLQPVPELRECRRHRGVG